MEYNNMFKKNYVCCNCGKNGHEIRSCREPITSWGIVNVDISDDSNESLILKEKFSTRHDTYFKIVSKKFPDVKCYISDNINLYNSSEEVYKLDNDTISYQSEDQIKHFCYYKNKVKFMMVSRRFSLGFIEFIRGKYDVSDTNSIVNLFEQMYDEEIKYIRKNSYDNILYHFLNRNNEPKEVVLNRIYEGRYSNEYCESKIKFEMLSHPPDDEFQLNLDFYTKNIKPRWKKSEWGFPKGRRDKRQENNMACACREFEEETGYEKDEYIVLNKIEPLEELLTGTNGVSYKHIYYLALNNCDADKILSGFDAYEIGDIKWFTYDEAMAHIRPYHTAKKKLLTQVYLFIMNYLIHNSLDSE